MKSVPKSPITTIIGFTVLSAVFMMVLQFSTIMTIDFKERISSEEFRAIAGGISSQIIDAITLAEDINVGGKVLIRLRIPVKCSLGHYEILLTIVDGNPAIKLKPIARSRPVETYVLPISLDRVTIIPSTVYSGAEWNYIEVENTDGSLTLKLVYIGG